MTLQGALGLVLLALGLLLVFLGVVTFMSSVIFKRGYELEEHRRTYQEEDL